MVVLAASLARNKKISDPHFKLQVFHTKGQTILEMQLITSAVNTSHLPFTYQILKQALPSILRAPCYNDKNLPFKKEVEQTEIGHLFEHILLEYFSDLKWKHGESNPVYNGVTSWNWKQEKRGVFHIVIDAPKGDALLFSFALEKSVKLLQKILAQNMPMTQMQTAVN